MPIDSLKPHPGNPRVGNVALIAESLAAHGQYSPIVVHESTRNILAGTHTWQAAKSLGWQTVQVTWFTGDEQQARRVLLADNRTADLATYDTDALMALLDSLPDLDGTGFDYGDVDDLDPAPLPPAPPRAPEPPDPHAGVPIRVGPHDGLLDPEVFVTWQATVEQANPSKKAINAWIRDRLGLPAPERPARGQDGPAESRTGGPEWSSIKDAELVPLSRLSLYPGNARQGDIGAICESLAALGQYRPVVANRRDGLILKGNHTAQAIEALGWERIAVVWVDVDEDEAKRIVLMDNRSSDVATYDTDLLRDIALTLPDLDGTGWELSDMGELGDTGIPGPPRARTAPVNVGPYRNKVPTLAFDEWASTLPLGSELPTVLGRLGIPTTALMEDS